jgi:hypothetical protein
MGADGGGGGGERNISACNRAARPEYQTVRRYRESVPMKNRRAFELTNK